MPGSLEHSLAVAPAGVVTLVSTVAAGQTPPAPTTTTPPPAATAPAATAPAATAPAATDSPVAPAPAPMPQPSPPASPPPSQAADAANGWDTLTLADGRLRYVLVLEQEPGSYVTVLNPDRSQETFAWSQVRSVWINPRNQHRHAGARPAGGVAPAPGGAQQRLPGRGYEYSADVDCSNSADERCRQRSHASINSRGAGFSASGQRLLHLKTPPEFHLGVGIEGLVLYGTSTSDQSDVMVTGAGFTGGLADVRRVPPARSSGGWWAG